MEVLTTTPFGRRPVTAGLMERAAAARAKPALASVAKWEIFRALTTARKHFELNTPALSVLNALLTFLPADVLKEDAALVVFPSNATLSARAHGMPESTLRRNLAKLVESGVITRHDSPNGKRYAHRNQDGQIARAFGFNLRPLLLRAPEILDAAEAQRAQDREVKALRERITLQRRDIWKLLEFARESASCDQLDALESRLQNTQKVLRRVLPIQQLNELADALEDLRLSLEEKLLPKAEEMSGCDNQNERHIQSSNKNIFESETLLSAPLREDKASTEMDRSHPTSAKNKPKEAKLPLRSLLVACPDVAPYCENQLTNAQALARTANRLHPMIGISSDTWHHAQRSMGVESASVAIFCITQRIGKIRNPGAYLRSLCQRAERNAFSVWPMLRTLLNEAKARSVDSCQPNHATL